MNVDNAIATCYLWNNQGTHDKVYNLAIIPRIDRFEVMAEYGRRGSVLKEISKGIS